MSMNTLTIAIDFVISDKHERLCVSFQGCRLAIRVMVVTLAMLAAVGWRCVRPILYGGGGDGGDGGDAR